MSNIKPFKISDLKPFMDKKDISDDDLLLVSDATNPVNGKKYSSRALEIGTFQSDLSAKISPEIANTVKKSVEDDIGGDGSIQKLQNFISNFVHEDPTGIELTIDCGDSQN